MALSCRCRIEESKGTALALKSYVTVSSSAVFLCRLTTTSCLPDTASSTREPTLTGENG